MDLRNVACLSGCLKEGVWLPPMRWGIESIPYYRLFAIFGSVTALTGESLAGAGNVEAVLPSGQQDKAADLKPVIQSP